MHCLCGHVGKDGSDSAAVTEEEQARLKEPRPIQIRRTPYQKKPGDYLHEIIASVGGKASEGCGCESLVAKMNQWGADGCRENRQAIVAKLQENAKKLGWWETVTMGAKLMQEPWFNPLDPAGSMVDEAIKRAEPIPAS